MTSKNKQTIIAVLSNSGGAGKSTIVRNLGYEMSKLGLKVALLDLDPQHNLDLFCGFPLAEQMDNTIVRVLSEKYDGSWSLSPIPNEQIDVCRGHIGMAEIQNELVNRRRSEYVLADRLTKAPLAHDVILIDCPATLGKLCENAIAAADYVLIPLILEDKALSGLNGLLQWLQVLSEDLALDPPPQILGIIPNAYDKRSGTHRKCLEFLQEITQKLNLRLYPTITQSNEIKNANGNGLAIGKYRVGNKATKEFRSLTNQILAVVNQV
jgi:chromosome partitioning protein